MAGFKFDNNGRLIFSGTVNAGGNAYKVETNGAGGLKVSTPASPTAPAQTVATYSTPQQTTYIDDAGNKKAGITVKHGPSAGTGAAGTGGTYTLEQTHHNIRNPGVNNTVQPSGGAVSVGGQQPAAGAVMTTYTDQKGNKYTGYIIDGKTYTDAAGTQEVPQGSYVTDAQGRVWSKGTGWGGASRLVYSPLAEDHYDPVANANNTKVLPISTPDGFTGYVTAQPDAGVYYIESSNHSILGYVDSAGQVHMKNLGTGGYEDAMAASAMDAIKGSGYEFNGNGIAKIATGHDQNMNRTYLINQYAAALDRGEDGADILRQLGYTGEATPGRSAQSGQGEQLYKAYVAGTSGTGGTDGGTGSGALSELYGQLDEVESLLSSALAANNATQAQQLELLRSRIQAQINNLNEQYQGLNRQLYVDYMRSRRDLPQQLAAQGYTGGLRESSLLGLETAYGEQLARNERERLSDITDIENGGRENEIQLAIENAKAQQEAQELAYDRAAKIRAAILEQQNYYDQLEREDRQRAEDQAQAQVSALLGARGDVSALGADVLTKAGYTPEYVQAMADAAAKTKTEEPKLTYAQVNDAIKNGNLTPQVLADYEYYYGAPYQQPAAATPVYTPAYNPTPSPTATPTMTSAGLTQGVRNIIKNGGAYAFEDAVDYAAANAKRAGLTDEEAAAIAASVIAEYAGQTRK